MIWMKINAWIEIRISQSNNNFDKIVKNALSFEIEPLKFVYNTKFKKMYRTTIEIMARNGKWK